MAAGTHKAQAHMEAKPPYKQNKTNIKKGAVPPTLNGHVDIENVNLIGYRPCRFKNKFLSYFLLCCPQGPDISVPSLFPLWAHLLLQHSYMLLSSPFMLYNSTGWSVLYYRISGTAADWNLSLAFHSGDIFNVAGPPGFLIKPVNPFPLIPGSWVTVCLLAQTFPRLLFLLCVLLGARLQHHFPLSFLKSFFHFSITVSISAALSHLFLQMFPQIIRCLCLIFPSQPIFHPSSPYKLCNET